MFSTFLTAALFIAPAIQGALADFAISSPALVQCQNATISWEPTKGPYNLIVVSAANPCGDALVEVGDFSTTLISWKASLAAGTTVQLSLLDASDNEAWSKNITVGASSDASCLSNAIVKASSSSGASVASTTVASTAASTTLLVAGTSSAASADSSVVPIGAANAGTLGSAAFTVRQVSTPLLAISGLVGAFALSL
ncbi:hypothetical protein HYPSUDRAFT_189856 [Hypholoma sublateritium FD-334 SS-4]|uniref:Uncharacterized protein n=1 Tax=Hypholoma sublateritium (strain FD-334 SS-4) TaxID=945553 RepID=A0A0D2PH74_HYPSF|nr:hypothetical protein HYPSUDRAFT_189856 [Hypholoma sublateritium FD-334 SS-4]